MNPLTAILVISLGGASILRLGGNARRQGLARALALAVSLIGGLMLLGTVGLDVRLDTVFFQSKLGSSAALPNRMAPNTALCIVLIGLGGVTLRRRNGWSASCFAMAVLIAALALIGYAYNAGALAQFRSFIPMAVNTAVALLILGSVGLLESHHHPLIARLTANNISGIVARRLLAPMIVVPLAIGWLRVLAERAGLLSAATAVAVMVVCTVVLLLAVTAVTTGVIHRLEVQRHALSEQREELIAHLQGALADSQELPSDDNVGVAIMVTVCSGCKKVPEAGGWEALEAFVSRSFGTLFSHGICPECTKILYPAYYERVLKRATDRQERRDA